MMKTKLLIVLAIGSVLLTSACGGSNSNRSVVAKPAPTPTPTPAPTPTPTPVPAPVDGAKVRTVTNGSLVLELEFPGQLQLQNGVKKNWTEALQQPYIDNANKWLAALTGVEGKSQHTIKIKVLVKELSNANGMAGPDTQERVGKFDIPTSGEMIIASHTYVPGFDQVEFHANILHEMGHIFGVGSFSSAYTKRDPAFKGNVFRIANSEGVKQYNRIYGTSYDFVPISDDIGHLYDHVRGGDKKRVLDNGTAIPPMTKEFMANGHVFGSVSLAILDDIGYQVSYGAAEAYTP